ncbi:MAG TPA: DUF222 domain-containing protein [Streptosporangiaceae bacterium]|jgi:hypothetical protein
MERGGSFTGTGDALSAAVAGLGFVAVADAGSLPGAELADCLRGLERAESVLTAARARVLTAFNAQGVFEADGQQGCRPWLAWQTRVTKGSAAGSLGWMRRLAVHPLVAGALSRAEISESWAKRVCEWSDKLQPELREDADQILLGAAAGGADLADLSGLAEEMYRRSAPPDPDDPDDGFGDRNLTLDEHYRGAGKLFGDLTPQCAAAVTAVLESLGKRAGPEDDRSAAQRRHDALEEACRRLAGSGMLPEVAGQATQVQLHMTLDQLRDLPGAAQAEAAWLAGRAGGGQEAGQPDRRAGSGGSAGAPGWLAGRAGGDGEPGWAASRAAAEAYSCDAQITPVVTGHLDPAVLAAMTRDYLDPGHHDAMLGGARRDQDGWRRDAPLSPPTARRVQDTLLRYAADVLSGPAGLAAFLRTGILAADLPAARWPGDTGTGTSTTTDVSTTDVSSASTSGNASARGNGTRSGATAGFPASVSLPLDTGTPTPTVPPHLRRAVARRDRRCAFPGCRQRPQACQTHHLIPRSRGGPTALWNLALLCSFHHLIAVHRWGWKLVLNADGTTTATSPDGTRKLHSHGPPGTAAA